MEKERYNSNYHGTGIGLSICKNIAKRMNMEIRFKSIFGQGSEFTIEIPILRNLGIKANHVRELQNINEKENISQHKIFECNQSSICFSVSFIYNYIRTYLITYLLVIG